MKNFLTLALAGLLLGSGVVACNANSNVACALQNADTLSCTLDGVTVLIPVPQSVLNIITPPAATPASAARYGEVPAPSPVKCSFSTKDHVVSCSNSDTHAAASFKPTTGVIAP